MNEKLLDKLLSLKAKNKELEQKITDLQIERDDLRSNLSAEMHLREEEKERYERIIAAYENGEVLKHANEDAEEYRESLIKAEEMLISYINRVEELEANDKNPFGAGRKKDRHLEVYLLSCWAKGMPDREIIGSEYQGFDGTKKVSKASYYRAKKRMIDNERRDTK